MSRAPIDKIEAYRKRMGWTFRWVSSAGSDFNFDFGVSFPPDEKAPKYNYGTMAPSARRRLASAPSAAATTARSTAPIRPTRAASTC